MKAPQEFAIQTELQRYGGWGSFPIPDLLVDGRAHGFPDGVAQDREQDRAVGRCETEGLLLAPKSSERRISALTVLTLGQVGERRW